LDNALKHRKTQGEKGVTGVFQTKFRSDSQRQNGGSLTTTKAISKEDSLRSGTWRTGYRASIYWVCPRRRSSKILVRACYA